MRANWYLLALVTASAGLLAILAALVAKLTAVPSIVVADNYASAWCAQVIASVSGASPPFFRPQVAVAGLVSLAATVGAIAALRTMWATRGLLGSLTVKAVEPSATLRAMADELGIGEWLFVSASQDVFSFCFGFVRPRICVSQGMIDALSREELRAVLAHEREHLVQRDPLKTVFANCLAAMAFPVPLTRSLRRSYLTARELDADRAAMRVAGRAALAGALHKVLTHPRVLHVDSRAAVGSISASRARLEQIVIPGARVYPRVDRREVLATAAAVLVMVAVVATPSSVYGRQTIVERSAPIAQRMVHMEMCDVRWSECAPGMRTDMCCLATDDPLTPCPVLRSGLVLDR